MPISDFYSDNFYDKTREPPEKAEKAKMPGALMRIGRRLIGVEKPAGAPVGKKRAPGGRRDGK